MKKLLIAATVLAVLGAAGSATAQYQRRTPLLEPGQGIAQPPVRRTQPMPYGYGSPPAYQAPSYDKPGYGYSPGGRAVGSAPAPMDPYARQARRYKDPTYQTYEPSYQRKRR